MALRPASGILISGKLQVRLLWNPFFWGLGKLGMTEILNNEFDWGLLVFSFKGGVLNLLKTWLGGLRIPCVARRCIGLRK